MFLFLGFIQFVFILLLLSTLLAIILRKVKNSLEYIAAIDLSLIIMSLTIFTDYDNYTLQTFLMLGPIIGWIVFFIHKKVKNVGLQILFAFIILILFIVSIVQF